MNTKMLLLTAACALAASAAEWTANIPFPFEMNGAKMPAGVYVLRHTATKPWAQAIHDKTGRTFLFDLSPTSNVNLRKSNLVFNADSGRYILAAVADPGTGGRQELPKSRAAKELARTAATATVPVTAAE